MNVNVSPDSADLARFRCDSSLSDQFLTRLLTAGDRISQVGQHFNKLMDGQENWYMHFFYGSPAVHPSFVYCRIAVCCSDLSVVI